MTEERKTVIGITPFSAIASAMAEARNNKCYLAREPYPVGGLFGTRIFASHWAVDLWRWNTEGTP